MTVTDWIQAISTAVLVIVTGIYVWLTYSVSRAAKKQAEASVKMAEEMRNTMSPSITIRRVGPNTNSRQISAFLMNEGFGPALNPRCYLTHKEFNFKNTHEWCTTFGVGERYQLSLPCEDFDFKAWNGLSINCDYESVLGQKFRSAIRCESQEKRSFEVIRLNSGDRNDQRSH